MMQPLLASFALGLDRPRWCRRGSTDSRLVPPESGPAEGLDCPGGADRQKPQAGGRSSSKLWHRFAPCRKGGRGLQTGRSPREMIPQDPAIVPQIAKERLGRGNLKLPGGPAIPTEEKGLGRVSSSHESHRSRKARVTGSAGPHD